MEMGSRYSCNRMAPQSSAIMNFVKPFNQHPNCHTLGSGSSLNLEKVTLPSAYDVYPPFSLPPTVSVTASPTNTSRRNFPIKGNLPPLLNPLNPPPPERRTISWETEAVHAHNNQRRDQISQLHYDRNYNAYSRYFYGSKPDKEIYK